jgi:RimK family alpha-L-glutamate ligase
LEEVVFYLDVLHALRELGVPVYNDARTIERSVDKGMTSFLLQRAGVPTPATWVTPDGATARAILMRESARGYDLVLKPLFGSCGKGIVRLSLGAALPDISECHGVYYLQRFVAAGRAPWQDLRLFVVGGRVCAAMRRVSQDWVTNVARGGHCHRQVPSDRQAALALDATRALNMDYAGVDVIRDSEGRNLVIEVNSIPSWKGLQGVCPINIAECLVDDFLTRRLARPRLDIVT